MTYRSSLKYKIVRLATDRESFKNVHIKIGSQESGVSSIPVPER
jgi:hypothetical protein